MTILHIQHAVPNYEGWKRAFDNDPADRKGAGVCRYHVHRSVADPNFVMIDLEFDSTAQAQAMLERLQKLWEGPGAALTRNAQAWVMETVESREL